jgi:hypothetical protein
MKYLVFLLALSLLLPVTSYAEYSTTSDTQYWEQKKIEQQKKSSETRQYYYDKYKSKWYDVSLLTPDLLDGTKTDESKFWETLKIVQNNHEVPSRREYVAKLQSRWYDISGFTEEIIFDSGKFWELVKKIESSTPKKTESTPVKTEYKEEIKKEYTQKTDAPKKDSTTQLPASFEKTKKLFIERIEKIPEDKKSIQLERLEKNIENQLKNARNKGNKILTLKLETLLQIVQDKRNSLEDDDDAIINNLFL